MKTQAAPYHHVLACILVITIAGCYSYAVFLYRQPLEVFYVIIPLLVIFSAIYIPFHRDHQGVTYEIDGEGIILWRNNHIHRRILFKDLVSVQKQKGAILLHRKGFWRSREYLHPKSLYQEFFKAIEEQIQNNTPRSNREYAVRSVCLNG